MTINRFFLTAAALSLSAALSPAWSAPTAQSRAYQPVDLYALEYAADPQISPDGRKIAYVRRSFDIMSDRARTNIWIVDVATGEQRTSTEPGLTPDEAAARILDGLDAGEFYVFTHGNDIAEVHGAQAADITQALDRFRDRYGAEA